MRTHKKDKHSKRGMDALLIRRRKVLDCMERREFDAYRRVVKTLGPPVSILAIYLPAFFKRTELLTVGSSDHWTKHRAFDGVQLKHFPVDWS